MTHKRASILCLLAFPGLSAHAQTEADAAKAPEGEAGLEVMTVEGSAIKSDMPRVGILGDKPILDTPFTVNSYSKELIEKQQSVTANQVLRNDPALTNVSTAGGFSGFTLGFRGFPNGADAITFNGLGPGAMLSGSLGQLYSVERIEVVKGPSAALGGFNPSASVGGSVNIVPKAPTQDPLTRLSVGHREKSIVSGAVDVSRRFGESHQFGARVNLATEQGKAFHSSDDERNVEALAFDYRISSTMRINLGYDAVHNRREGYQNAYVLAPGIKVPKAPNPNQQHFQDWAYLLQEWNYGYGSFQWDLAERWSFEVDGIWGERRRPILSTGTGRITSANGDMTLSPSYLAPGTSYQPFYGANAFIRTRQDTGRIQHQITASVLANGYDFRNAIALPLSPIADNLYRPVYVPKPELVKTKTGRQALVDTRTYALSDSIQFLPEWNILLAAKNTTIHYETYDVDSGIKTINQNDSVTSPVAALSYKPLASVTTYLSYVEGLERGGTAPVTAANANAIMPSAVSHQWELGAKSMLGRDLLLSASLFQIERELEYLDAGNNVYVQNGLQRNKGFELSVQGSLTRDVSLTGGFMILDPAIVRSGALSGREPAGVPKLTVPLLVDYNFGFGISANVAVYHFARQYVDAANTQSLPVWTRYDAGLQYQLPLSSSRTSLNVNVENIGNKRYWASAAGGQLALGAPEIWRFAIRTDI